MQITMVREAILPAAVIIGSVVERRQTLPILGNVLVHVFEGGVGLTATDLEVEVKTTAAAETIGEGEFTVPAKKFLDICRTLPEAARIVVRVEEERADIRSGRSRFLLGTLPAADYPSIEGTGAEATFEVGQGVLKRLFDMTAFSMAQQDVRYYLNGLLVELSQGKIRAVATDGHRLALGEAGADIGQEAERQVLLPRKAVMELSRLLDYGEAIVTIELTSSLARFRLGTSVFTTKLIDGRFPDYEKVIPRSADKTAIVDREMFRSALARASILSTEKYKGIRLTFDEGSLRLQAHNPEQEEAEDELEIDYEDTALSIGFNVGYLLDILNVLESEKVALDLSSTNTSTVVRVPGDEGCLYVVMPMRL